MRSNPWLSTLLVLACCGDSGTHGLGGSPTAGAGGESTMTSTTSGGGGAGASGGESADGAGGAGGPEGGSGGSGGSIGGDFRILQLNLCHSGVNTDCFTGDDVIDKAIEVIEAEAPALVTLNEACRNDVPLLASSTGAVDHQFTPALEADGSPVKCVNGDDYGNGLLSWREAVWKSPVTGVYSQQSSTSERRVWICMGYEGFVGCTTHLTTMGTTALAQCQDFVSGPLATAAASGPALMGGDWNLLFNGDPNAQDCVPDGFFRKGDGSVQHVIASDDFGFVETVVIDMGETTDHPGLAVRLTLP